MTTVQMSFGKRDTGVEKELTGLAEHAVAPCPALFLHQLHGTRVICLQDLAALPDLAADAVVTTLRQVALAIKTADCAPVMLFDEAAGVIAAIHSGWLGTLHNIVQPTVALMERAGARRNHIQARIGPCLQQVRFEMGSELYDRFMARQPDYALYFQPHGTDKFLFDNAGLLKHQLMHEDVMCVIAQDDCTLGQADMYYSHRARHHDPAHETRRNVSLIWQD